MLDFLRRSASSFVAKTLLLLLVASFAVWGIGDIFRARTGGEVIATVGKAEISVPRFQSEFARELDRVSQLLGQPITREQANAMGVDKMLLQRLINTQVMQEGAKDLGLMASDAVVLSEIKRNDQFYDAAGKFDRRIYTDALSRANLSEAMYVTLVRDGMVRQQFLSPISGGSVAPKALVDTLYKHASETRTLDVVRISHAKIKGIAEPSDTVLSAYHAEHTARFMAPEYRAVTAVVLDAADLAKTIDVSPNELMKAYDERAAEFTTPEARTLSQILVKDEIAAGRAVELLGQGKSIADVAGEVGANAAMVKLGVFTRAESEALSADIAEAAFTTALGSHSAPVKSPLGWHVIAVDAITPGTVRKLDEVKDELIDQIRNERTLNQLFETSNQLQDSLAGGQTLEEAAKGLNLSLIKLDAIDANGLSPQGLPFTAHYAQAMVAKVFELSEGSESAMIETDDNKAFFVVRVDSVTQPAVRPLASVKEQVAAAWKLDQMAAKAETIAADAKARLEAGESAAAVAQVLGFDAFTTEPFTRNGQGLKQGALPATLMVEAFNLKPGQAAQALGTDAHSVARLKSVTEAALDATSPLYTQMHDSILRALQGDLASQLAAALQANHPVTVNQAALANLAN